MSYIPPHMRQEKKKQMRQVYSYKSVVIPYIETTYNNKTYRSYVLVKDAKYKELTFVVGGCKLREISSNADAKFYSDYESYKTCALRELKEETRSVFGNVHMNELVTGFKFSSKDRSVAEFTKDKKDRVVVTMRYTVYFLPLDIPKKAFYNIKGRFNKTIPENDETSDIVLKTKSELQKANVWDFMKINVLRRLI